MPQERDINPRPQRITRRDFVKLALAGLMTGCHPTQQPIADPTSTKTPRATIAPTTRPTNSTTPTRAPTATATQTRLPTSPPTSPPTFPPTAPPTSAPATNASPTSTPTASATFTSTPTTALSKVVHTHHVGVWDNDSLLPSAIRDMLDASITELTGLHDASSAWASLFTPQEQIAIKVNTIRSSSFRTHVPLVMAVTERLQEIGIPGEQIIIFDRMTSELKTAGYPVNQDGPGVRCYGTDSIYTPGWRIMDDDVKLSDILLNCSALINIPILKQHDIAGISFAMKNHYGTFDRPGRFHRPRIDQALAELNALEPIKDRTRLIIGDALAIVGPGWYSAETGDSVFMSFDPVALDMAGLQLFHYTMTPGLALTETSAYRMAAPWLENGAALGLGTHDPAKIEMVEVNLV